MTEPNVTGEQQVIEAFGLGSALATIGADVKHVLGSVSDIKSSLGTAISDIGQLKTNDARQDEQLRTLFAWKDAHDAAPRPEYITKGDFDALRTEVAASRLTWPKLLAGLAALGTVIIGSGSLLLAVANSFGLFGR